MCLGSAPVERPEDDGIQELGGSPTRARTWDLRINSPSLYQLSYRGIEDSGKNNRTGWTARILIPRREPVNATAEITAHGTRLLGHNELA